MQASALDGLKVIDLTRVLGGPYCTQILADHGARVIKVEPPQGDETRAWGPPFSQGTSAYFQAINRNKTGIVLDLAEPVQRGVLLDLLEDADVLVENFKSGTLEKWGIGYHDSLAQRFPRLVHCSVSGFGHSGPMGGQAGYDAAVQALSGLMSVNGEKDAPPLRVGVPIVDMVTGLNATIGILLALQERERSGLGQYVDIALFDCAVSLLHPHMANFLASGKAPVRSGNAHPNITPYDVFPSASGPIFLAVGNDGQFRKLCDYLGRPDLAVNPDYATNQQRSSNRDRLCAELEALLAVQDGAGLCRALMAIGVPCAPVLAVPDVVEHPHTKHREMLIAIGEYRGTASPLKLSRTPAQYRLAPPRFGEHTGIILDALGASKKAP
ncbi:CaiB/BaiF CoA transferase family protein [Ferrovibrio sp.]|uniref:CaiB/BaiF CoA transferase family protein n=1 Tax=Ferrovibrio sp. TaxID=1917215 RepID=UPI003D0A47AE